MILKSIFGLLISGVAFAQAPPVATNTPSAQATPPTAPIAAQVKSINASTPAPKPSGTPDEKVSDKKKSHKRGYKKMYALFDTTMG